MEQSAKELSKIEGRSISRNDYAVMIYHENCNYELLKLKEDKFDKAVASMNYTMNEQTKILQEFIDSNNRLFHLMASGIDLSTISEEL
uniref:hypothetical protein n=1 Tax=Carnobacterium sp. TaxID=48221 RepID=UPI00344BE2CA